MYIKQIIINGFKSFADKVNITLTPNFTGIVGPNGSGKSNVVDAIKWVLGEQSVKSLRGSVNMSDVIFNGSKSRSISSFASVCIIFDNSNKSLPIDFNEVSIKRVLYRSGESEYFLNNEKCRLKDISDLFVDSFSSKESFNIIPQGKIDEILSDKPEDRRGIFEEAAGVLKYKRRKEESLRKLSSTHENVDRVDMIIKELESQLNPLKSSSLKAMEFKKSKSELESIEIALLSKDITSYNTEISKYNDDKENLTREIDEMTTTVSSKNVELEKQKLDLIKVEESLGENHHKLVDINEILKNLSSRKVLLEERSKYDRNDSAVKSNLIKLNDEELKLKNEISILEIDIDNLKSSEKRLRDKLNEDNNELQSFFNKRKVFGEEYNLKQKEKFEVQNKISILENSIVRMEKIPFSVKSVLNNPLLNGIINTIGNVIETEEKYSLMLDVSLGASSNFVIVEDEVSAKEAINYLKANNKGRATFFPLTVIKPKSIEPYVLDISKKSNGFIGIASDLVTFDKKFYNIVMNQLGNIIVSRDLISAQEIGRLTNYRYKIVSIDGEVVHPGGSVTGGSVNEAFNPARDKIELVNLKMMNSTLENKLSELDKKIKEIDYNINIFKDNVYKTNAELLSIQNNINLKQENYNLFKTKHIEMIEEIKSLSTDKKDILENEIKELMNEFYDKEKEKNIISKMIENLNARKQEIQDNISNDEMSVKKLESLLNKYKEDLNNIELKTVKISMNIENNLNRLNEEYSMSYEKSVTYELEIGEKEAREKQNELRRIIKSLGEVNLGSIEEYERINKRYTYLTSQKEDLLNSEKNLLEIISSMDEVMKDKFSSTFNLINKEFGKVFKDLFGGGEASLKLTDPSNILETGIEIIAVPSGKTLKSISLLSGGEKTLTAISLLFAIMNLRNVHYAILDEVESALDEANAIRFGEYLQKYKGKTQLLIITHQKKTMEFVDLLYGITMQESGVSKLVSVKLEDIK